MMQSLAAHLPDTVQHIYLISDATGETAERSVMAALTQFPHREVKIKRFSNVRNKQQVYSALDDAVTNNAMVVFTVVNRDLAKMVYDECDSLGIPSIDLITPMLVRLTEFLGISPDEVPGLLHSVNDHYFKRIEAIEFAVKHDDGQETRNLHKAEIVLVGVSRASKTPLSIYLAHRGWKVANVPMVKGIEPPEELFEIDPKKIAGLVVDPQRLFELRTSRLRNLGQNPRNSYADYENIEEEMKYFRTLFRRNSWITINVTGKAIEETANEVLVKLGLK